MEQDRPRGIVNHPWLVLTGLVGICIAAALLSDRQTDGFRQSDWPRAKATVCVLRAALEQYAVDNGGRYPDSLQPLVTPDELGRRYLQQTKVPRDPWNREYIYKRDPVNVASLGADGRPGGTGDDADIDYDSIVNGR